MTKRLLYLEDLYDFYSNTYKRSTHFDSKKNGEPIIAVIVLSEIPSFFAISDCVKPFSTNFALSLLISIIFVFTSIQ